jgi:Protein of unknown function (DUF1553)
MQGPGAQPRYAGIALAAMIAWLPRASAQSEDESAMCVAVEVPLERQLRQLYLDLLGRPPRIDEYRAQQRRGALRDEDIAALMKADEFYERMKTYHRALLRANVSASVPDNGDTRVSPASDGEKPLESRGNLSTTLRGRNGQGCDHFIPQDDCKNGALQQDPHAEGPAANKVCRDANGVPLPVSYDFDNTIYACTALSGATSCSDAVTKNLLPAKHLFYCDMRRGTAGLAPFLCLPDPGKPSTALLTVESLDAEGHVIAFSRPQGTTGGAFDKLDRCTLALPAKSGVVGTFAVPRGCIVREGWVLADAPFWDGSGAAKVPACAIEAQVRDVNPATMSSCQGNGFLSDRSCGCGQNFRRCESGDKAVVFDARVAAINEEPVLLADSVLRRDEDYFHILTTRRSFINGVLSSLYHQRQAAGVLAITPPVELAALPDVPFTAPEAEWTEYVRGENASGVLTTPAWLYRFPTQRARVAQFYEAFLCKSFAPPADAISPNPEDACNRENNLAKRCGCNYCHATIEPTGAHWGRFGERNAQYLEPTLFPKIDTKCRDCALSGNTTCDGDCGNYVMQAYDGDGANSLGMLKTYLYRTSDDEANIEAGPRLLVSRMLQTGDLERCAVSRMWQTFLGRPMSSSEEALYLDALVQGFIDDGRDLKQLIRRVVTSDAYRRID